MDEARPRNGLDEQPTIPLPTEVATSVADGTDAPSHALVPVEADALDGDSDVERSTLPGPDGRPRWMPPIPSLTPRQRTVTLSSALGLIALVVLLVYGIAQFRQPHATVTKAHVGDLSLTVHASGTLQSATYSAGFATSGTIAEIPVRVGDTVSAGDTLAKLDTASVKSAVDASQATLSSAQSALTTAQSARSNADSQASTLVNAAATREQNAIYTCQHTQTPAPNCEQAARADYAAAQAQADALRASADGQVNAAQAQVNAAQSQLTRDQAALDGATLKAPHDGTIAAINGAVGSTVAPGNPAALFQIVDLAALQVRADFPARDIVHVRNEQSVRFTIEGVSGKTFGGTVTSVAPLGTAGQGGARYPVVLDVDMHSIDGTTLLPGMTADVTITTDSRTNALLLPASAVSFAASAADPKRDHLLTTAQVDKAKQQADQLLLDTQLTRSGVGGPEPVAGFVVEVSNGRYVAVPVVLGLSDGHSTEVLAGLKPGDRVATGLDNNPINVLLHRTNGAA